MKRRSKYIVTSDRLAHRIKNGDYHLNGIPSERQIALDVGVSYMTARKAIEKLIHEKLLIRLPNGRLDIQTLENGKPKHIQSQVALLIPSWNSSETNNWHIALSRLAPELNFSLRLVYYLHADDPVIKNTLSRFDLTFFIPHDPMPEAIIQDLKENGNPLVIICNDWSQYGIPSIQNYTPVFTQKMLDHLDSLGHKKIDCLNVQPGEKIISERISQWRIWIDAHNYSGDLHNYPVQNYSVPLQKAYLVIDSLIKEKKLKCDALLCITEAAAIGAMKAMVDNGICPGVDIGLCLADSGFQAEFLIPGVTSLSRADPLPFLKTCIKCFQNSKRQWEGQLLLQPTNLKVIPRQSTVPDIKNTEILLKLLHH